MAERRTLYPPLEPYEKGYLKVSDIHEIYYEQSGNANGKQTVIVLHGGPGGGVAPFYRQFFDPTSYRIIMFDQRGAGASRPHAELRENTTWDLVEDIEKLRHHLKVDRWVVFGGSWGSTLALAYAETQPDRVKALILRGIFMLRRKELLFFYQEGTSLLFPDYWEKYLEPIPPAERFDMMSAYHRRLTGPDDAEKLRCARAWTTWEMATSRLHIDKENVEKGEDPQFALAFARIECHYFVNAGFFKCDGQLLEEAPKLKGIPGVIVQGRYDVVCPAFSAWDLHKKWPEGDLKIIPDAGHSMKEPGILSELVIAADRFRDV
jgi:proline iminopeptidase